MKVYPFDLQLHSAFSDGDFSPKIIFERAKKMGLKGAIITDHNTVAHFDAARQAAEKSGLVTFEGLEISTASSLVDIHILGYAHLFNRSILQNGLKETVTCSHNRLRLMVKKLQGLGYKIDFSKMKREKGDLGVVFKYDLIKKVHAQSNLSIKAATKLMERGGMAYVPYNQTLISPFEAVRLIKKAGGLPVLAHPGDYCRSDLQKNQIKQYLCKLIDDLKKCGLAGLEIRSGHYNNNEAIYWRRIAKKYQLMQTGGSDWHGEIFKPEIKLGSGGLTVKEFARFYTALSKLK